ncbi:hypothetical protein Xen7305DRAFT_00020690 [Xenococcus sp. PCC 7305]|nr:hypothetical protein Xen7305DRAFT_00020690 [Xenococcus sp. PCC 7305]
MIYTSVGAIRESPLHRVAHLVNDDGDDGNDHD